MHSLCVAYARTRATLSAKDKGGIIKHVSLEAQRKGKKNSLEDQTHFCLHELRKHTIETAEE